MSVPAGFPEACVGLRYLVALLRGGKVSYKRLDDLTREDRPASWYEGIGHTPFLESTERFNQELADFARQAYEQRRERASLG